MRAPLEQSVLAAIQTSRMLSAGSRVGVAVSGGADSVALLRLLHRLRDDLGITLAVVHFDHALRGDESEADAAFVAELAGALKLEFLAGREDVGAEAARRGWNLEDAARRLRYAFFKSVIGDRAATHIAVAHTADDQAETLLAHLIRGTGPTGLGGIHPVVGAIVRPLLGTRREALREYLRANGQRWREDSTNRDVRRTRARIREQLLPVLERDFSGAIVEHLSELARLAREEGSFWDALVEDRVQAFAQTDDEGIRIAVRDLLAPLTLRTGSSENLAPPKCNEFGPLRVLTERLIRRLYEVVRGNRLELGADHVQRVVHLASGSSSGHQVELPGGIIVRRNFGDLIFSLHETIQHSNGKGTAKHANAYQYVVKLPLCGTATVSIPELGKCFRLKVIDWPVPESDTKRDGNALDADLLRSPLILRNWRPGDAYRPRGRHHELKLKSMFLAERVPSGERTSWPVVESGGRVIWAKGMPAAEDFRATESTRTGVVIEEEDHESGRVS